jgi:hypothetical protein
MEKSEQLRELFRMQKALNERLGVKTEGLSEAEGTILRVTLERKVG